MKRLIYSLFIFLMLSSNSYSQIEWDEHLSHDRMAYKHLGHYIIDGKLTLLMGNRLFPMNTLETIEGNTSKTQEIIREGYTFTTKTTRTGIDSKEILLKDARDYDILGNGAFSIYERNDIIQIRDIQGYYYVDHNDALFITDAYMSGGPLDNKECVTKDNIRYFLTHEDEVIGQEEFDGEFIYHEGLDGLPYQILNGTLSSITLPPKGPLELGNFNMLDNDPYENHLVKIEGTSLHRYSYDDFSLIRTDIIDTYPIAIQFVDDGFYYFTKTEDNYIVYKYTTETSSSEFFYELPRTGDIEGFDIKDIEVIGNDIYFIGLWRSPDIIRWFSYVQKRTLNEDYLPIRKDLEISSVNIVREESENQEYEFQYNYKIEVKNVGTSPIDHFTIFTNELYEDFCPEQFQNINVIQSISPSETYEIEGINQSYGYNPTQVTFYIMGVDYGFDSDESNNSYTADIIILSSEDEMMQKFTVAPNPASDYVSISGSVSEIQSVKITDVNSRKIQLLESDFAKIDISSLQAGQYWIQIETKTNSYRQTFIKI